MNKLCLILLTISICAAGCTTTYRVHVNGFSELDKPISDKASIYVTVDPNSQNPIFDKEIKAKIEMLLKSHGYIPAPDVEPGGPKGDSVTPPASVVVPSPQLIVAV